MERITFQELPDGLIANMMKVENYINNAEIDMKLLELIRYRVSQINGCAYCLDMHHKEAIHIGETELRLHSLAAWREAPFYSEKEKAVLAYAEAVTQIAGNDIGEDIFTTLTKFFSKAEIANLTLAISHINSWTRLGKCFRFTPGNYQVNR
ncbi:carboxymuconolactone decarboxylase family protein [Fulvivirgaceae bacterium BMA10]|uniref:Carboxymuconolactone decarboxylase family protein n=1 Tax=Splendidivirga corallicola TaxID=3051826 RepID=A0ABT8KNI5_9BACT|nr:carboxymuconolactone decarboxylase family protein [Fulvivirgaceae bacterium BMA10]